MEIESNFELESAQNTKTDLTAKLESIPEQQNEEFEYESICIDDKPVDKMSRFNQKASFTSSPRYLLSNEITTTNSSSEGENHYDQVEEFNIQSNGLVKV